MDDIIGVVALLVRGLAFAVFVRAILSWFPIDPNGPIVRGVFSVTEPVLEPLRRVIPRIGMIDISPMVAMLLLFAIASVLDRA
ncbi:MAG: YggT family protein [Chloroflexi bacterium]|nr:YggT family protein [Chloroflexota bacterium]